MAKMVAMVLLLASVPAMQAATLQSQAAMEHRANPIRKVVTMLQSMQKKVEAEGEKEKELYDKFMCSCKTGGAGLKQSISDAETKIPQVESSIKEGESKLAQLKEDLTSHKADRDAAKKAMAEAKAIRAKDKAAYDKEIAEDTADLKSLKSALAALEGGVAGSFLQTESAQALRRLTKNELFEESERDSLAAFLSESEGSPGTGEIIGILKQMGDEMDKASMEAVAAEKESVTAFDELTAAKTKEVKALTKAVEEKTSRVGTLSVSVVEAKNDLEDTEQGLEEDKKVLNTLETGCSTKTAEFEARVKTRTEENLALADTIKLLNDDDALELFKKTLPGASSFMQVQVTSKALRARALDIIHGARKAKLNRARLDFIALALRGRKVGFEQVIGMIDEMVGTLKKEQTDDDSKKEYCEVEFDKADDKKKGLERSIKDLETTLADTKESIETAAEDIKALTAGIQALDKSVAEATEQRKAESADYTSLMASDGAAKEVLGFAKNRLNKFYNPKLYKAPPKRELSEEDRIVVANGGTLAPTAAPGGIGGTGIEAASFVQVQVEHNKQESNGVIAMIDLLVKDLDKEMTEAKTEEKDSQADYEQLMKDSAEKRSEDAKALENKESAKADMEESFQKSKEAKTQATKELGATKASIAALHSECDWLIQYFDVRKEARTSEIDSLSKAKAVLSGADYSLGQGFLARN
jgi:septal ring factor EnvC (AmiA/AmiB activator)